MIRFEFLRSLLGPFLLLDLTPSRLRGATNEHLKEPHFAVAVGGRQTVGA